VDGVKLVEGDGASEAYFVVPEALAQLPWLADPGSCLATVHVRRPIDPNTGSPGSTSGFEHCTAGSPCVPFLYKWMGTWPDIVPIALRVTEASFGCTAKMELEGNRRTLIIAFGPAEQATLDIVSCPSIDDVTSLGVAHWAGASSTPDTVTQHI